MPSNNPAPNVPATANAPTVGNPDRGATGAAGNPPPAPEVRSPAWASRLLKWCGRALLGLVLFGMTAWGTTAIWFGNLPAWLTPPAAAAFLAGSAWTLFLVRPRRRVPAFVLLFTAVLGWWLAIPPSNDRDWQPDVAVLPSAEINGDRVVIHNIRNCLYRSETDFDVRHYDAEFDLKRLRTMDLYLVYWGSPHIAHTMLSFGFDDGRYVCVSIETRKRKGQSYSTVRGFFKQYEITYVVGDERDLVGLRARHRGEQVYLYRIGMAEPEAVRGVFLGYLETVNELAREPEWYNALTSNCTSNIRGHTLAYARNARWSWKLLLTGHVDELVYENGALDTDLPFAELKTRSNITEQVKTAGDGPDFSRRIRAGLPGVGP